uniref:PIN2/TERF1-interacting telomerase inhibitor 1 (inferred by orthology to a human protein) n=1 Tax=Strongyloides venezuelensis TaxID=75913 RepID=A0A0K0G2L7_STRVS
MSILAERRRKQKIPIDPNNLIWQKSENSVAKKLLSKMGWQEGKGLGKDEQGDVEGFKVKSNTTQKGLGYSGEYDKTWVGHHDDFASILANLNKNKKEKNKNEEESSDEEECGKKGNEKTGDDVLNLEERARVSRRRIHYQKFIKRKDLSQATDADKFQIFGKKVKKNVNEDEVDVKEEEEVVVEKEEELVSSMSMTDYFAAKLQAFHAKQTKMQLMEKMDAEGEGDETNDKTNSKHTNKKEIVDEEEEQKRLEKLARKKAKKERKEARKLAAMEETTIKEEVVEEEISLEEPRKKKSKKIKSEI